MASDLISREALVDAMREKEWQNWPPLDEIDAVIANVPAVDAVEVVRCKDCAYWKRVDEHSGKCPFLIGEHQYAGDDHYCSCGDRREEDAVD